jgi:hypothetical protein
MRTINKLLLFLATAGVASALSCSKDDDSTSFANASDIKEESVTDTYYQDLDGLGSVAIASVSDEQFSGGRTSVEIELNDYRICSETVVSIIPDDQSTVDNPSGELIIEFGTAGCQDLRGNIRKGTVVFRYSGRRFISGSTVITTLENYSINGIMLQGIRTSTNVTENPEDAPSFHVTLADGSATYPDQTVAERESDFTWTWERAENPANDKIIVHQGGTASGMTRRGNTYDVTVLGDVVYQKLCPMAIEGIKQIIVNGENEFTIDYGNGDCDRDITVGTSSGSHKIRI